MVSLMHGLAGDNLAISLFFGGLAVTFAVAAMSQAGWKHWALISLLFVLAAASLVIGVAWPLIKGASPVITYSVMAVATSPVSWFVVVVAALMISLLPPRRGRWSGLIERSQTHTDASQTEPSGDDLSALSDDDLARRVTSFELVVRGTEAGENSRVLLEFGGHELMSLRREQGNTPDRAKREFLQEQIKEREQKRSELLRHSHIRRLAEFNRKFAHEAIRFKVELSRRTGHPINGPDDPTVELLSQHNLNDKSLEVLCNFLREMVELLPNRTSRWL